MSYRLKNKILIVGFLISLYVVYKLAIYKTIEAKSVVSKLTNENKLLKNAAVKIVQLQQQQGYLDSILNTSHISINNSFQQTLLQHITSFSKRKKLQIVAFNQPHEYLTNDTKIATFLFEVKGDFISLLQMIHYLEKQQLGKLISVHFIKKRNYLKRSNYLTCTILLQKIEN